jgi:hypothetical protein
VIKLAGGDPRGSEAELGPPPAPPPAVMVAVKPTVEPIQPAPAPPTAVVTRPAPVANPPPTAVVTRPAPVASPTTTTQPPLEPPVQVVTKAPPPPRVAPPPPPPPSPPVEPRRPEHHVAVVAAAAVAPPRDDPPPRPHHTGKSLQDVKNDASALYRAKNFAGASSLLQSSLTNFAAGDAQDLKSLAAIYAQLGKAYNVGMAPGTKATEAFTSLRHAVDFDRSLGGAFSAELKDHLVNAATRAASSYMAAKDYEAAFQAVRVAESLGSTSSNNKVVRSMLESIANDLYRDAAASRDSDPEGAKRKARQVLGIVDPSNPLHDKAQRLSASL